MNYSNSYSHSGGNGFRELFGGKNALSVLMLINIGVFVIMGIIRLFSYLYRPIGIEGVIEPPISQAAQWLSLPASLSLLAQRPWTLITYMFLHESLLHIFFNMLMLYFGGKIFMEYLGNRKLVATYLFGGIVGGLLYVAAFNLFPAFAGVKDQAMALGASAAVLAILVAIATFIPNYSLQLMFFGRMKLKYIAIFFVVIDILSIEKSNPGGHIAHLGGALWGFLYIIALKKGTDLSKIFVIIGRFFKKLFTPKPKLRVSYSKKPLSDDEYSAQKKAEQAKIDAILDKISRSGYESLSKEEKEALFKSSGKG